MSTDHKTKYYIKDYLSPYFIGFKLSVLGVIEQIIKQLNLVKSKLDESVIRINNKVYLSYTDINTKIQLFITNMTRLYKKSEDTFTEHIEREDNPHEVKLNDLVVISALAPTNGIGNINDIWIEYEDGSSVLPRPDCKYVTSAWSTCSVSCGGGTQTRSTQCVFEGANVDDSYCNKYSIPKPISSRTCNTVHCPIIIDAFAYTTPRHVTLNTTKILHTYTNETLTFNKVFFDLVTITDSCGHSWELNVIIGNTYWYKRYYNTNLSVWAENFNSQAKGVSVCDHWDTVMILNDATVTIPYNKIYVGCELKINICMVGGDDCCKGMHFDTITIKP